MPALRRLAAAVFVVCVGCHQPAAPVSVSARWIENDPENVLELTRMGREKTVVSWPLPSPTDLRGWQAHHLELRHHRRGVQLRATGNDPRLVRRVSLAAATVHKVSVTLRGLRRGSLDLRWAAPDARFQRDARLTLQANAGRGAKDRVFTFDLLSCSAWRGQIDRLRVDIDPADGETPILVAITGSSQVLPPDQVAEVAGSAFKVELGNDLRNAILSPPGHVLERRFEAPANAIFEVAFGLQNEVVDPVRFHISTLTEDGRYTSLMNRELSAADDQAGRWFEHSIELRNRAGEEVVLRLRTTTEDQLELARGFPVWANPEILTTSADDDRPNVVLICIDTLRADRLSSYGHDRRTSPEIDAWAATKAVRFENVVASAPWTLPSHASIFTGLDAVRHGVNYHQAAPPHLETVAEILRREGYTTAAATGGAYLSPEFGFAQGFDSFVS